MLSEAANAAEHFVRMKSDKKSGDVFFEPQRLKVKPGDTVIWVQEDASNPHNVSFDPHPSRFHEKAVESPMLTQPGDTWTRTFLEPGKYAYHCHPHVHLGMTGLIIVDKNAKVRESRDYRSFTPRSRDKEAGHGGHSH